MTPLSRDKKALSAEALEATCPNRDVFLRRIDGHAAWVSLAAMRAAGLTDTGNAVLPEHQACSLSKQRWQSQPARSFAIGFLPRKNGSSPWGSLASARWASTPDTEAVFARASKRVASCSCRVAGYSDHGGADDPPFDEAGLLAHLQRKPDVPSPDHLFAMQGAKIWADGALGSRGAALIADNTDAPGHKGTLNLSIEQLTRVAKAAVAGGWQLAVLAIGDQANKTVLDAYEAAGVAGHRFRIEHAQVIAIADVPRFAKLGVVASMQPTHATSDMRWAGDRLGEERLRGAYAWRSLAASGVLVAFGSDFPVESANPWEGMHAAVTRTNSAGEPRGGWRPQEAFSRADALRAFSESGAYAAMEESFRGSAHAGQVADLTVIDRNVLAETADLRAVRVDMTIVGGRVVYER